MKSDRFSHKKAHNDKIIDYFSVFSVNSVAWLFEPMCLCGYESIMQNKANLRNDKMNTTSVNTMNYEPRTMNHFMRYKPKQSQSWVQSNGPISNATLQKWGITSEHSW